ncbi:MAG: HAD family hydrolase [Alicyclobacillaceae bacterium]|uniref:Cof-type HAD-IIB family hydrolase n=1 Tax=Alicyclobacillus sp. SP_1 TaxID=2942475 RepID=UPI002157FEAD|nr:HAD family hydrolase [Alicyclobacillus sp. SP_1]MCY0896970.1 HAD family hydrolase [Alicyclobacillaceae bacterium]
MPIQFVFLDIDGTIYSHGRLVPSAVKAIQRLQHNHIPVALCTGRSLLHTRTLQCRLGIRHGVYFNGSLALTDNTIVHSSPFEPHVVELLMSYLESEERSYLLHSQERIFTVHPVPDHFTSILRSFDFPPVYVLSDTDVNISKTPIFQMNAFIPQEMDHALQSLTNECFVYRWDAYAVDLQRAKSDKSHGALALLRQFDIAPESALHIGDGGNDIGMFQRLGHSVAMGNAPREVQEQADWTTTEARENGVYNALHKLNLI